MTGCKPIPPDAFTSRFIGVIDLQDGLAVHGVGGDRDHYLPVGTFNAPGRAAHRIDGHVQRLIDGYHSVGIDSLYVADLNGIRFGDWQRQQIRSIVERCSDRGTLFLDLGFRTTMPPQRWSWIESLVNDHANVVVILATECATDVSLLSDLLTHLPCDQIAVSLDYKDGRWVSEETTDDDWFDACRNSGISTVIGLDLASVGSTSIQRTLELCKRVRLQLPHTRYITGGGVRGAADARRLFDAGADQLLVASLYAR
ncbi:1-(5-phosphoribosyl)-5-[(5-phosphoribosylamino)methylideneamino] imidazole-4-carboxamide isomerase [Stieleria maiorica]|uniref:1-(5-phosphoribosyl)-5-[(5-phosphoribosylamino)methylideneamino] imidazole-4-carboxamide isomerase n=1 Tax=Stieleria maiorica TaxID=2795974 RepID=A0A5B9MHG1_9BACT|nr:HisA/HisF-related TIM barrel protein [Stieleria maiorica]QEF99949.1 1-(5-phosphoribosyl)-5-[(5-phosphoribosylamino)methylideneamino] imidazole-4-carboxamide isomerase [Stieleria maiorica]